VKKMAVKVLVPVLVLLMLVCMPLSMTSSASACKVLPVKAYITGLSGYDPNIKYVVIGNIMYLQYFKFWGTISMYIDGDPTPVLVNWVDVACGTYNIATNRGSYTFYEVWTLLNGLFAGGQLVGFDHPHTVGDPFGFYTPVSSIEGHIIVVGIGECAGQVIDVVLPWSPSAYAPYYFGGYWLTP